MTNECAIAYITVDDYKVKLRAQENVIHDLELANKNATEAAKQLNKMLNDNRAMFEKEKAQILKDHKKEIKAWKKDLGLANSNHIKLEKKFALLEATAESESNVPVMTSESHPIIVKKPPKAYEEEFMRKEEGEYCSLCAILIENYIPDYFCGEMMNPCCLKCKGSDDSASDPFSSFPDPVMPLTLASHWIQPPKNHTRSLSSFPSLRTHYVLLPNPGDTFVSADEVLSEFKKFLDELRLQRQSMLDEFKL